MLHTQSALCHCYKVIRVSYATSPAIYKMPPHGTAAFNQQKIFFQFYLNIYNIFYEMVDDNIIMLYSSQQRLKLEK